MLPLLGTVLIASFFGSLHCVGMCGPLAILASSRSDRAKPRWSNIAAYHGSRILAYSLLGFVAGTIGAGVQQSGVWFGAQRLATQLAGGSMLLIGLLSIVRLAGGTAHSIWLPQPIQRGLAAGHQWSRKQPPLRRAATVGLLTAILPCGWLYAFLLVAAGSAHGLSGSAIMATFGLGAVPALGTVVLGTNWIAGRYRTLIPWASALLVTVVGLATLVSRSQTDLRSLQPLTAHQSVTMLVSHVEKIDSQPLPCCAVTGAAVCECSKSKSDTIGTEAGATDEGLVVTQGDDHE